MLIFDIPIVSSLMWYTEVNDFEEFYKLWLIFSLLYLSIEKSIKESINLTLDICSIKCIISFREASIRFDRNIFLYITNDETRVCFKIVSHISC